MEEPRGERYSEALDKEVFRSAERTLWIRERK